MCCMSVRSWLQPCFHLLSARLSFNVNWCAPPGVLNTRNIRAVRDSSHEAEVRCGCRQHPQDAINQTIVPLLVHMSGCARRGRHGKGALHRPLYRWEETGVGLYNT